MENFEDDLAQNNVDEGHDDNRSSGSNKVIDKEISEILTGDDPTESSLLNSIVEAVMRGDMNQVVTLALSHRNIDPKDKVIVDEALSTALRKKLNCDQNKAFETYIDSDSITTLFDKDDDSTAIVVSELSESKKDSSDDQLTSNSVYSATIKSDENNDIQCSYYIDSSSLLGSSNNITYCHPGFHRNVDIENQSEELLNESFSHYQTNSSSIHNIESLNSLNTSQQSVQVQLPGIGNFLLQIPSNLKPGEPITLPISLPLTPVSQTSGGTPISINMSTGQLISNQLISLYNPSSCINNITIGKKMRAIAPKPSKPTYRQPLIAPKTSSPNLSAFNQDCMNSINSTPLPAPSGPGRRKGSKSKKTSKKQGVQQKSRKDSSYASSTHSIDSQDAIQYNEPSNTLKQNCNNFIGGRNTYQCNYFVNGDSSDYINQSHIVPQSFNELHSSNLLDTSDCGEKDLLSLAWEISNAELGNNDDFSGTYQLYDTNHLSSESFVSSEILDQFLQNIQKDDISELSRGSSNQINIDPRVSYTSSFTTLPPCSTVLPSVTTASYLNNSSNDQSHCIEIAEVVNLNTEDMLSELENEENALLDKFVAQYSSNASDSLKCDTHMYTTLNSSSGIESVKYDDGSMKVHSVKSNIDDADKDLDLNIKESNELSEIAKQIEKDCDESNICNTLKSKNYLSRCDYAYLNAVDNLRKSNDIGSHSAFDISHSVDFCSTVTAPLELLYSTSTDSFSSTVADSQSNYLMSVNMDSKRHTEPTFYITDGSMQSKTLDDFGLFDFCTERMGNENSDVTCLEEKKYLEPPILEDISDASPIPSDEESEDEDVDLHAFKLSTFNHLPLCLNEMREKCVSVDKLCYNSDTKDLPTLLETLKIEQYNCSSDKWYIYDTIINVSEVFSYLGIDKSEVDKDKSATPDRYSENKDEDEIKKQIDFKETSFIAKQRKQRMINKLKSNLNGQAYSSCFYQDRQSRLRKPPMKLAIYHSIKSIEKELSAEKVDVRQPLKSLEIVKKNKPIDVILKSNQSAKANHCTRSQGSISKSYDSFYETLEKTIRHQNPKIKKVKNHLRRKKTFKSTHEKNYHKCQDLEVIDPIVDLDQRNQMLDINEDPSKSTGLELLFNLDDKKNEGDIQQVEPLHLNSSNNLKIDKSKKTLKVSKKYNLRQKFISSENDQIVRKSTFTKKIINRNLKPSLIKKSKTVTKSMDSKSKGKETKRVQDNEIVIETAKENEVEIIDETKREKEMKKPTEDENKTEKEKESVNACCESNIICYAEISKHNEIFDFLTCCAPIVERRMEPVEKYIYELHTANVQIKYLLTSDLMEYKIENKDEKCRDSVPENSSKSSFPVRKINRKLRLLSGLEQEHCPKDNIPQTPDIKSFPVRKINRKLRLLSGLEYVDNIKYAIIFDLDNLESFTEYWLNIQSIKFRVFSSSLISNSECKWSTIEGIRPQLEYQHFEANDEDFDDGDSCDARLVIVENEEMLNHTVVNNSNVTDSEKLEITVDDQSEISENSKFSGTKTADLPKRYSLRNKLRDNKLTTNDMSDYGSPSPLPVCLKRRSLRRTCKKVENNDENIVPEIGSLDEEHLFNGLTFKNPICSIEKLTNDDLLANMCNGSFPLDNLNSHLQDFTDHERIIEHCDNISRDLGDGCVSDIVILNIEDSCVSIKKKDKLMCRIRKRIAKNKSMLRMYKNCMKCILRAKGNKKINYSSRLSTKFQSNVNLTLPTLTENLTVIDKSIEDSDFKSEGFNLASVDNDNVSIEVDDDNPSDNLCTFVDSNNVETFSRSYGSFSLKIKFQKQDPIEMQENKEEIKKHKRNSRKRKRLRHFLSRIIRSNELGSNRSNSDDESGDEDSNLNISHGTRKRKHSNMTIDSIESTYQNLNQSTDLPPKLSPECNVNEDYEHQKPIKIKLFKSACDEFSKSEEMVFSLQKSSSENRKDNIKSSVPKMLQVLKEQPSKPCRQAANLAKKKIFSTAKEFRRSQNATLTSIWNPRKINNASNKLPTDFISSYNDRGRKPRGRPPKSSHISLLSEKQTSSTGTLKLKIRLSKDFKNCTDDNLSSNGEISGRTSTNDSSILNSAVAGINGPSDALSLESNNFINVITQQLDENIEYLEAKEAKVYFDPHQVDIEKIKNSYYSSKKNSSMQFDNESQPNLYDDSAPDLSNKKKDSLSINEDFSQYNHNESSTSYNNNLSKDYSKNCYTNLSSNREPQDLSLSNQSYSFENQMSSPGKNQAELWQSTKPNSSDLLSPCRNFNNAWFSEHRSFPNSNSILYDSYITSNMKEGKSCASQNQNTPFILCEDEISDTKNNQRSSSKRSSSKEGRKSSNNSFESHGQLSPNYSRGSIGHVPPQLNINPWSDEANHNTSLNHTAAAWMTYAQQQAAATAYMDPQMKAYYNLALSQSMLNNPYCGTYGNPAGNPENFYSSLHSQYLNNSKDLNDKNSNTSGTIRNHNDPMGTFMEAAQMSSWEHFYSAAAMAGYHNSSQGAMEDYTGRAGNMLQAHHMLTGGYPGSVLSRDHFALESTKPPLAHQSQSGSTSPMKPVVSPTPVSSAQTYSHVQMPYNHFNGTPIGFF